MQACFKWMLISYDVKYGVASLVTLSRSLTGTGTVRVYRHKISSTGRVLRMLAYPHSSTANYQPLPFADQMAATQMPITTAAAATAARSRRSCVFICTARGGVERCRVLNGVRRQRLDTPTLRQTLLLAGKTASMSTHFS